MEIYIKVINKKLIGHIGHLRHKVEAIKISLLGHRTKNV